MAPGERLYEVPLAQRLGLSRTPVRDALTRLEQEGLWERPTTGGYAVRAFTFADVADCIETRGTLEGLAARLAAERGVGTSKLAALKEITATLDATLANGSDDMDFDGYVEANNAFHAALADLPASSIVAREVERVSALGFASPSAFLEGQGKVLAFRTSLLVAQAQHRSLVEAIEARQGARAEAIAREHARLALNNLEYVMTKDRGLIGTMPVLSLVGHTGGTA